SAPIARPSEGPPMAKCGLRSNHRHKKTRKRWLVVGSSGLARLRSRGLLPVSLGRRPCHVSAHAATDPSHPQALPPCRIAHLLGRRRHRGVGALLDGPRTDLQVRLCQALAWRPRRCRGVAAPDRLVHLQPYPARIYLLLAAVDRLAGPSIGGGAAADR